VLVFRKKQKNASTEFVESRSL